MIPIEMDDKRYCDENGVFCPFMDRKSGLCVATSCRWALDILMQQELDRQAQAANEIDIGRIEMLYRKVNEEED